MSLTTQATWQNAGAIIGFVMSGLLKFVCIVRSNDAVERAQAQKSELTIFSERGLP
jgi:hypothetical protein